MTNRYRYTDATGEHLHTLDGQPLIGTSRVGNVLAKPLTWWASGLAVQTFGCPDPKLLTRIRNRKATPAEIHTHMESLEMFLKHLQRMDVDDYAKLVDAAYRAHQVSLKDKASEGTDLHAEVERYVKSRMSTVAPFTEPFPLSKEPALIQFSPEIQPFIDWSRANVKRFLWSEGHVYSERMWTGGISDIGYEDNDGNIGICDIKSSKEAYLSQFLQCAGYSIQALENGILDADGNVLYTLERPVQHYCIFAFGATPPQPYFYYDMAGAEQGFEAELLLYRMLPQE